MDRRVPEGEKKQAAMDGRKDGVAREVIRMEREAVIPILKPKLIMRLAYLIGERHHNRRFSRFLSLLSVAATAAVAWCCEGRSWSMTDRESGDRHAVSAGFRPQLYILPRSSALLIRLEASAVNLVGSGRSEVKFPLSGHRLDC